VQHSGIFTGQGFAIVLLRTALCFFWPILGLSCWRSRV